MKFPVIIEKGEARYIVEDQSALDYHIGQGWSVVGAGAGSTDLTDEQIQTWCEQVSQRVAALDGGLDMLTTTADALNKRVTALETGLSSLRALVELQGQALAALTPAPAAPTDAPEGAK